MAWTDDTLEPVFLAVRAGVAARRHLTWAVAMANPGRALSAQEIAEAAGLDPKAVASDRRYAVWAVLAASPGEALSAKEVAEGAGMDFREVPAVASELEALSRVTGLGVELVDAGRARVAAFGGRIASAGAVRRPVLEPGAVVVFPVHVVAPRIAGGRRKLAVTTSAAEHAYPLRLSHEPGDPFVPGLTEVTYTARVDTILVEGSFWVGVGLGVGEPVPEAMATFSATTGAPVDPPTWAHRLPTSLEVETAAPDAMRRALRRTAELGRRAWEHQIPEIVHGMIAKQVSQRTAEIRQVSEFFSADDAFQECYLSALDVARGFCSPGRPDTTWGHALWAPLPRDLRRGMGRGDGNSVAVRDVRRALEAMGVFELPESHRMGEARRLLGLHQAIRRLRRANPALGEDAALAEATALAVKDPRAVAPSQSDDIIRRALDRPKAPLRLDAAAGSDEGGEQGEETLAALVGGEDSTFVGEQLGGVDTLALLLGVGPDEVRHEFPDLAAFGHEQRPGAEVTLEQLISLQRRLGTIREEDPAFVGAPLGDAREIGRQLRVGARIVREKFPQVVALAEGDGPDQAVLHQLEAFQRRLFDRWRRGGESWWLPEDRTRALRRAWANLTSAGGIREQEPAASG